MCTRIDKIDKAISFKSLISILIAVIILFSNTCIKIDVYATEYGTVEEDKPIVVSMGDSFSSGESIEPFYDQYLDESEKVQSEDWLSHRSEKGWPGMLEVPGLDYQTRHYKDENWFFVAVSGAKTKHLKYEQDKEYSRGTFGKYSGTEYITPQLDVFKKLEPNSVDYVTLTLGGNDAGFAKIITEGVIGSTYINTSKLSDKLKDTWDRFYKTGGIRDCLYDSYKDIEEGAGSQAQIIVAGYPHLLDPDGKGTFFSKNEAEQINTAVTQFNIAIENIVNHCATDGMKICFVSVEEAFEGHEAYSDDPYINKVILGTKSEDLKNVDVTSAYSMHPNYDGAIEYAKCVNQKIEELVAEEEARLEEEALNPSAKNLETVLVLDGSGSMEGTPMTETKTASYNFVDTILKSEANIGIVYYDDESNVASPLTDSQPYLNKAIDSIYAGGNTNIEAGLKSAEAMLQDSSAEKKIIVLMSDGEPNEGKVGEDLIDYADELKSKGYYIYTLGFFSNISDKASAQNLMGAIASEGCHYEVAEAESLVFFFGDIADQIGGQKYIYVRIACPVDVTVTHNGETMTSKDNYSSVRTSFGSMTFEENEDKENDNSDDKSFGMFGNMNDSDIFDDNKEESDNDDRIKILRLKEGAEYDIKIEGNGVGSMDYTIGFMDEDGEYSDLRKFSNIKIKKKTEIDTVASVSDVTYMYVDEDGDGEYDLTYKALEDSKAEIVDYTYIMYIAIALVLILMLAIFIRLTVRHFKIRRYLYN